MRKPLLITLFCVLGLGTLPVISYGQAKAPAKAPAKGPAKAPAKAPTPVATATATASVNGATPADSVTGTAPAGVSLSPATPPASPTALKVKAEMNPVTNKLNVRTDAPGPMRVEVNDSGGRPVLTKNVLVGNKSVELNVSQLPAGTYVVRCTAGEKTGMRLVRLGQ